MKVPTRLKCSVTGTLSPSTSRQLHRCASFAALAQPRPGAPSPRHYATAAASSSAISALRLPDDYVPPTKPPSNRPPEVRKSQLLRTYTALLRSSPVLLIFQHNNLTGAEFAAIRRELAIALEQVSEAPGSAPELQKITSSAKLQVVRKGIFDLALRVVEFFDPSSVPAAPAVGGPKPKESYTHDLSAAAIAAAQAIAPKGKPQPPPPGSTYAQLQPLMAGPLAVLSFAAVSPAHLAAALRILAPHPPAFPPPARKKSPGYYDPITQSALQKILLIGGRIEGRVFDFEGVQWVGGIEGGLDGLRAQLVALLQSAGLGLTAALEGAGKSLWLTVESRRSVMEEEGKGGPETTPEKSA